MVTALKRCSVPQIARAHCGGKRHAADLSEALHLKRAHKCHQGVCEYVVHSCGFNKGYKHQSDYFRRHGYLPPVDVIILLKKLFNPLGAKNAAGKCRYRDKALAKTLPRQIYVCASKNPPTVAKIAPKSRDSDICFCFRFLITFRLNIINIFML